ncbi:hypothetical protein [Streptomyces sp. NPDC052721]|uniref:hypothetical protein n=1 Tax=Streptomyces sp. NPDC052721 TaxID=3154955 RepID=UPI003419CEDE
MAGTLLLDRVLADASAAGAVVRLLGDPHRLAEGCRHAPPRPRWALGMRIRRAEAVWAALRAHDDGGRQRSCDIGAGPAAARTAAAGAPCGWSSSSLCAVPFLLRSPRYRRRPSWPRVDVASPPHSLMLCPPPPRAVSRSEAGAVVSAWCGG